MMVRRLLVIILALILLTPSFPRVGATSEAETPFITAMSIRVGQTSVNGTVKVYGLVTVYLRLSDETLIEHFEEITKNNETLAREEFHDFIYESVYIPLRTTLEERLVAQGLSPEFYMPETGDPVYTGENWSAAVSFLVMPFFVPNGTYLSTPLAGPLVVNVSGSVYPLRWTKLTVVFSSDYQVVSASPEPAEANQNTLTWYNGDYLPSINIYSTEYLFAYFVNSTKKSVVLSFDPTAQYVHFNATFVGFKPPASVVKMLLDSFRKQMYVVGISAEYVPNGVRVIGVVRGSTTYTDKDKERVWTVMLKFPGPFDSVTVVNGDYTLGPGGTIILTFTEEKTDYSLYAVLIGGFVLGVVLIFLWRRRKAQTSSITGPAETDVVSEEESGPVDGSETSAGVTGGETEASSGRENGMNSQEGGAGES